ncbi:transglycosylase domain-containing protein [Glycomyces arizonensis]|uniref:transglycosylase domain-containing protein n=1 Tax=Glycomyces arizonensis TaxID=256035 RepID=UPI0003FEBC54|nr:transglycosylase domain-containing protein [Glycomyces arizonensis]
MSDYERRDQYPPARPSVGSASVEPPSGGGNMGRASVVSAVRSRTPDKPPKKKKRMSRRRRRVYAALILVALMMLGSGTVVGAAFFQSVPLPEELAFGESTTFTYADGETAIAGYGEFTRKLVDDYDDLPRSVIWSLLALEDKNYFEHDGVDYKGTLRALVNNVTGGDTQGASTISQQYAGMVANIRDDISYGRKAREAIMAMKLEQEYSKEDILLHYLNLNFYNRGAYGIAAASEVWFGKKLEDLTWGEAMMLVMQVKAGDGSFDPRTVEEGDTGPLDRWTHGMESLLTIEDLTEEEQQLVQEQLDAGMPETRKQVENPGSWGHDTPTGFITNPTDGYVWAELESRYGLDQNEFYGHDEGTGGYTVALTIDPEIQKAAEDAASRGELKRVTNEEGQYLDADGNVVENPAAADEYVNEDGYFEFEDSNENAALYEDYNASMASSVVAVEPGTGRVLGYYGGENGLGVDKAGIESPHPPSSTFKMITAATAIKNGASIDSWWNSDSPREFDTLEGIGDGELRNGQHTENTDRTLTDSVRDSRNTPMYAIAEKWGATAILETAIDMGVRSMSQNEDGEQVTYKFYKEADGTITYSRHGVIQNEDGSYVTDESGNLDYFASLDGYNEDGTPVRTPLDLSVDNAPFYYHISFGQFPTSVMNMSTVYATIAADGVYNETHFVEAVYDSDGNEVQPIRDLESEQAIDVSIARNLQWVGSVIDGEGEPLDRPYTGKTGTWEAADQYPDGSNAHTWYVGAIPQLSIAAWVGNATAESAPLLNKDGGTDGVFGATLSYPVWIQFMNAAIDVKGYEEQGWTEAQHVGTPIVDDILNEDNTIDADSPYCAQNPTDTRCGQPDHGNGGHDDCSPIQEWLGQCTNEENDEHGNGNGHGHDD